VLAINPQFGNAVKLLHCRFQPFDIASRQRIPPHTHQGDSGEVLPGMG